MKISRLEGSKTEEIQEYDSQGVFVASIIDTLVGASLKWLWFDPHSKVGSHEAISSLIYIVINGEGWIQVEQMEPISVITGDCVLWDPGDLIALGSDTGMQVIAVESRLPEVSAFQGRQL